MLTLLHPVCIRNSRKRQQSKTYLPDSFINPTRNTNPIAAKGSHGRCREAVRPGSMEGSIIAVAEGTAIVSVEVSDFEPSVTDAGERVHVGAGTGPVTAQES